MGLAKNGEVLNKGIAIDGESVLGIAYQNEIIWKKESGLKIPTFQDGTDEEIAATLEKHYSGEINIEDYWHVGDTRKIHLNGIDSPNENGYTDAWAAQDITIVITALNHHDLNKQIGTRTKAAITVQTRECLNNLTGWGSNGNGCVFVNLNNDYDKTFNKWSQLPLRTWMNDSFLATCFSTEMQNMIKETKHKRLTQYNSNKTEEVVDKLFLPSYPEIFGNDYYIYYIGGGLTPRGEEGTQWDYYKTSSNRIKEGNDNGSANGRTYSWWPGSPSSSYPSGGAYFWCEVDSSGYVGYKNGSYALGLAPAFCL